MDPDRVPLDNIGDPYCLIDETDLSEVGEGVVGDAPVSLRWICVDWTGVELWIVMGERAMGRFNWCHASPFLSLTG